MVAATDTGMDNSSTAANMGTVRMPPAAQRAASQTSRRKHGAAQYVQGRH